MANADGGRFASLVDAILNATWESYPNMASGLGLHEYDGRLPDISRDALSRRAADVEVALASLGRIDPSALGRQAYFDYRLITGALRKELFELGELRLHETSPIDMMWHIELSGYIKRDYAPLQQRIESLAETLEQVPAFLESLKEGLSRRLSGAVLEASHEAYQGLVSFYEKDLAGAAGEVADERRRGRFRQALGPACKALRDFLGHLRSLKAEATPEFAIGADKFSRLLEYGEMVELPLKRLLEVGLDDLDRNRRLFEQAAARVDARRAPSEVMADVAGDHPTADALISVTRDMLENIRQFVIDHEVVSIPSEVRCQTVETPTFMRWAFAAMDMPGPFETKATEAFYYVTPVEQHWSDEQKEQWLTSFNHASLQNVSIHEAYPGHYVHYLHTKTAPSKVSRIFGAYSFWEGWAHYTEQMMVEEGYIGDDPRLLMGQLGDALLRNCRYVCAIRMHTDGMTVDEATRYFMENAYMEELPARKEAIRGTFDPQYLNYTLGKLMILKLREDYKREAGSAFSLKKFHDTFLSFGAPPIPLVREMMLAKPGTAVL